MGALTSAADWTERTNVRIPSLGARLANSSRASLSVPPASMIRTMLMNSPLRIPFCMVGMTSRIAWDRVLPPDRVMVMRSRASGNCRLNSRSRVFASSVCLMVGIM